MGIRVDVFLKDFPPPKETFEGSAQVALNPNTGKWELINIHLSDNADRYFLDYIHSQYKPHTPSLGSSAGTKSTSPGARETGSPLEQKVGERGVTPAFAAARMTATLNPDVEIVGEDPIAGTITLREKKTGKTAAMDVRDIQKGRYSFNGDNGKKTELQVKGEGKSASLTVKGPEGTMEFGAASVAKIPAWVPKYPGGQVEGGFSSQGAQGDTGTFQLKSGGSVEAVAAFYEREMKTAGMTVQKHSMQSGNKNTIMVMGENTSVGHTLSATVTSTDQGTSAQVQYGIKK